MKRVPKFVSCLFALGALQASPDARAEQFERPPSVNAENIPWLIPNGNNYSVASPVNSDGFLRIYVLKTPYGEFPVHGDAMLRLRLRELATLSDLEKVSNSESFNKALVEAGLSPIKYTGAFIANPVGTLGDTMAGIGSFFGQIGSGFANAGKVKEDPVADLLGVTKKRRELAARLGIDPYTDFEPLSVKLSRLSEAAAVGGLAVNAALIAIPGVVGVVVGNVSTGSDLSGMARDYTAAQLMDLNRPKLAAMGVDAKVADALLTNRSYTPLDVTALIAALESMGDVEGRPEFVARAASVSRRDVGYFMRRQAELLAEYQARTGAITAFISLGDFPFNRVRGGGVMGLWPVDALSWTDVTSRAMQAVSDAKIRQAGPGPAEIRITGQATPLTRRRLKELGWAISENVRS